MIEVIDLKTQQARIKDQIDAAIQRVLAHGQYILGPEVAELEEKLAAYTGAKHCITVANGTDALQIAQMALGIGPGAEIITPGFTYIATAETVALLGVKPVYVDIDPRTYNLDPALLEASITPRTKAIVPVSLYGQCADFDAINAIAAEHRIPVIEDAAQSFGATYKGRKSCNLSTIACASFFPSKPLGCYGDGGAVFANDDELAKVMRQIARHGQDRRYHHIRVAEDEVQHVVEVHADVGGNTKRFAVIALPTLHVPLAARGDVGQLHVELGVRRSGGHLVSQLENRVVVAQLQDVEDALAAFLFNPLQFVHQFRVRHQRLLADHVTAQAQARANVGVVQVVGTADRHVVQHRRGVALELMGALVEAFELREKLALRRDAVDDANRVVDVVGNSQVVAGVVDGAHVARSDIAGGADQAKFFMTRTSSSNMGYRRKTVKPASIAFWRP